MEFLGKVIEILDAPMTTPTSYGWFHLLWVAISVGVGVLLCVLHKKGDDKRVRRVVFWTAVLVFALELYKMFNYTFSYEDGKIIADFQWYAFPWQFCSTPMYVGLLTGIFRKGKIHDALCAYLATYAMFAGLCVMIMPGDVFIETIGINIQTMVCHGSMITVAVYLWFTGYVKASHKTILKALCVFAVMIGVAITLNEVMFYSGVLGDETFNMFYISRHFEPTLLLYSEVHNALLHLYPLPVVVYFTAFTLASYIIVLVVMGIRGIVRFIRRHRPA